jgi:DNA-binding MarR family transcriptional regulator
MQYTSLGLPGKWVATGVSENEYSIFDLQASDPGGVLVDRSGLTDDDVDQINRLMAAMGRLRDVERKLADASRRFMRLNETDMRALHFLIANENRGSSTTASTLARHLGITTASTTKMLDRLQRAGHITRNAHPDDRRALCVSVTPETKLVARDTVGRQQAARIGPAARLDDAERCAVIMFLEQTADALEQALAGSESKTG